MRSQMLLITLLGLIPQPQQNPPAGGQPPANTGAGAQTQPNNPNMPANGQGSMYRMPVDGTYQVLAYEKFSQVLPGMNTIKVVIRNNVMYFPGDTKNPGKMLKLTFGPNNTITVTPLDGRDPNQPNVNGGVQTGNTPPQQTVSGTGQNNNVNQTQFAPTSGNTEHGVYVLSNEYFSIAITGTQGGYPPVNNVPPVNTDNPPVNTGTPPANTGTPPANTGIPPVNVTPPIGGGQSKAMPPAGGGSIIRNPRTGGTDAPGPGNPPPSGPGGPTAPGGPTGQGGTTQQPPGGIIRDPRTGGTDAPGPGNFPPNGPGNGVCSAVIVLRRVAN